MDEFVSLSAAARRTLARYESLRAEATRLRLAQLEAHARLRLVDVLAPGFDPLKKTGLRSLAALAQRKARALNRLLYHDRAIKYVNALARRSRRAAGLGRGL